MGLVKCSGIILVEVGMSLLTSCLPSAQVCVLADDKGRKDRSSGTTVVGERDSGVEPSSSPQCRGHGRFRGKMGDREGEQAGAEAELGK